MKPAVILDKSFLQGAPTDCIRALATTHRLVVSGALFYELLTGPEPGRSRCFAKLPQTDNPVELVDNVGRLMRVEMETQRPAGKPSSHREEMRFRFNPGLVKGNYAMPLEAQRALEDIGDATKSDVESFLERAIISPSFFPGLSMGSAADRVKARQEAEEAIADTERLLQFYAQLESPDPTTPFPPHALMNENWAILRWLQVNMLFGIDLYVRYSGNIPEEFSTKIYEKLEHDVHDAQVLILGCLEGAFATREKRANSMVAPSRPNRNAIRMTANQPMERTPSCCALRRRSSAR